MLFKASEMANRYSTVLKIIEATALAVLLLLFTLWGVNAAHPLFLLIHADPEKLHQWYPNFGWLMPYWAHIILPLGIGGWTLALTTREKMPFRWVLMAAVMVLQLITIQFWSLQASLLVCLIWVIVGYSRTFLANTIHRVVESSRNENTRLGAIILWFRTESDLSFAKRVFFCIVTVGVVLRVGLAFVLDGTLDSDSSLRMTISYLLAKSYWPDHNILWSINPSVDWLPLHFYLNAALITIGAKLAHLQLFHAIVGVASAVLLYRIARQLGSRETAMGATTAYLFYPASMIVCTQTLSEPLFLLTVLLSLYYFQRFYTDRAYRNLVVSAIALFLGSLLRYEGWALLPVLPIVYILFVRPYKIQEFFTLLLPGAGPLLIAVVLVAQGFHPLRGLNYSDYQVTMEFANAEMPMTDLFIFGYAEGWIPFSLFSLIIMAVNQWGKKKEMIFVCFLVLFIAPFVYKNFTLTILPDSRYLTYYMSLLLIPLSMVLWRGVRMKFARTPQSFFAYLLCMVLLAGFGAWARPGGLPTTPRGYFESIAYVDEFEKGQYVVSEQTRRLEFLWTIELGMLIDLDFPPDSLSRLVDFNSVKRINRNNQSKVVYLERTKQEKFKVEELDYTLAKNKDLYLVLYEGSLLDGYFQFRENMEHYKGHTFYKEFEKGEYRIYRKQQ